MIKTMVGRRDATSRRRRFHGNARARRTCNSLYRDSPRRALSWLAIPIARGGGRRPRSARGVRARCRRVESSFGEKRAERHVSRREVSSAFSIKRSALSRKCWSVKFSRVTASGPFVGNLRIEKSCAQCELSHPSPRQNFRPGSARLYSSICSSSNTAMASLDSLSRTRSPHFAMKSSSSYSLPRIEIQSRFESPLRSLMNSPKRPHAVFVDSISTATSSRIENFGLGILKLSLIHI